MVVKRKPLLSPYDEPEERAPTGLTSFGCRPTGAYALTQLQGANTMVPSTLCPGNPSTLETHQRQLVRRWRLNRAS